MSAAEVNIILNDTEKFNEVVKMIFDEVDKDGSGFINKTEFGHAMTELSAKAGLPTPNAQNVEEAVKTLDTDEDGKISQKEFSVLVRSLLQGIAQA